MRVFLKKIYSSQGSVITTSEVFFNSTQDVPSYDDVAMTLLNDTVTLNALNITSFKMNDTGMSDKA